MILLEIRAYDFKRQIASKTFTSRKSFEIFDKLEINKLNNYNDNYVKMP